MKIKYEDMVTGTEEGGTLPYDTKEEREYANQVQRSLRMNGDLFGLEAEIED